MKKSRYTKCLVEEFQKTRTSDRVVKTYEFKENQNTES